MPRGSVNPYGKDEQSRYRGDGLSIDSVWDLYEDVIQQAKLRGCAILGTFLLCVALFFGGLAFPLVEVVIFPGSDDMETHLVKSVWNMITLAFENGQSLVGMVMLLCTVGIPIVLFIGMLIIMYENFFSLGFGRNAIFSSATRALVVSLMYVSTSYQVVMIFLVMLFTTFFTGFGSQTFLRAGFHFLAAYCLASIGLVQAMEFLRIESTGRTGEESDELARMDSVTGFSLRRRFSSFFPSLPGIKETTTVDAFQVFFFQTLFLILLLLGFDQPLLDIRVMYDGIAMQRMVMSLRDIVVKLAVGAPFPVVLLFVMLVVVIPVFYGFTLVTAGILDTCVRWSCGDQEEVYEWILWVAKVLRPWVMIDVFSIALVIVLYAVQNEYVSATIPGGVVHFGRNGLPSLSFGSNAKEAAANLQGTASQEYWLHFFSGMYLIVGAGISTIFLRWFWSTTAGRTYTESLPMSEHSELQGLYDPVTAASQSSSRSSSARSGNGMLSPRVGNGVEVYDSAHDESFFTRYVAGKSCRCLTVWVLICTLLHRLPPAAHPFQLSTMNQALDKSLPMLNKLLAQYAPQTIGNCKYPLAGVPQPCFEHGMLDKEVLDTYRISAEWMSGMKSVRLTNISITKKETLAARAPVGLTAASQAAPAVVTRWQLSVAGVLANSSLFLKIEECPRNHTTLKAIIGQGQCKPFLDTADSCCEPNRQFRIDLAAECHLGKDGLRNTNISEMTMDTMTVRPVMWRRNVKLLIADKNITKMVIDNVKANILYYLTGEPLLHFSGQKMNVVQFVNHVLRFNAPHEDFHCR
jgi:uncharacterized paraquat-inducible protein A